MTANSDTAWQTFQLENKITTDGANEDNLFHYDAIEQKIALEEKPWTKDPNYFKKVKISAVALLKMVTHARSGGSIEVMGLMQGKVVKDTMIVTDAFALPVEGTETRVNAQAEGYEYMVDYMIKIREVGRQENAIGWYHSHPGYGCWLSGIDVSTQMLNQQFQEPFLAVVIDPNRTVSAGKVDIGAFRTYPKDYQPGDTNPSEYQTIPLDKIEDFGVHCKQYYQLEVSYFKSVLDAALLDLLWNKYWINTLAASPLLSNSLYTSKQIADLANKMEQAENIGYQGVRGGFLFANSANAPESKDNQLAKLAQDSTKISAETSHGLLTQVLKHVLFNISRCNLPQLKH